MSPSNLKAANYYELLGVTKDASKELIKQNYKKLAITWHPDKNSGKEAEENFKRISEAYHTLSDDSKRRQYDREEEEAESIKLYTQRFNHSNLFDLLDVFDTSNFFDHSFNSFFSDFDSIFNGMNSHSRQMSFSMFGNSPSFVEFTQVSYGPNGTTTKTYRKSNKNFSTGGRSSSRRTHNMNQWHFP